MIENLKNCVVTTCCEGEMQSIYNDGAVIIDLKELIARGTTQKSIAQAIGKSEQFLSDIIHKRRKIPDYLARYLGYEMQVVYYKRTAEEIAAKDSFGD